MHDRSCSLPSLHPPSDSFDDYKREHHKVYDTQDEHDQRRSLFRRRLAEIRAHNADTTATWRAGVNHLTDRTDAELREIRGLDRPLAHFQRHQRDAEGTHAPPSWLVDGSGPEPPASKDWRDHSPNIITAVKNQGMCGSCWTFAATETLESHNALYGSKLLNVLSEQFILDCTPNPNDCGGTGGCGGGTGQLAYARLKAMGGMTSEWMYPYRSITGKGFECMGLGTDGKINPKALRSNVTGMVSLPTNAYAPLLAAVGLVGPVAISVDASSWQKYESGVYTGGNATNPTIDHLVQLIGYGDDPKDGPYWLVRNSWSPAWGEKGFIRLKRYPNGDAPCGEDLNPAAGNGCKGGPSKVKVCGQNAILYDNVYPTV